MRKYLKLAAAAGLLLASIGSASANHTQTCSCEYCEVNPGAPCYNVPSHTTCQVYLRFCGT